MAAVFLVQATNTPTDISLQTTLLLVLLLASKGAAGVARSAFITLSAVSPVNGNIPVTANALILSINRFISGGRSITNIIVNTVAAIVVAKSENEIDMVVYQARTGKKYL